MNKEFKALIIEELENGSFKRNVKSKNINDLPKGDVLIKVEYSSLNYKDALSASGNKGITKHYPHTPGIDAAGIVQESNDTNFKIGDQVIVTSYDLGMNTPGGFGQYIRVPKEWVVKLPQGLTTKEAMIFGTAGFTAAQSLMHIIEKVTPEDGEILVTGATGGVGSMAVAMLAKLGYKVAAITGKIEKVDFLNKLGATRVIMRQDYTIDKRPLLKSEWAGVIDTVGGDYLANAIKSTNQYGIVTTCGNVNSIDLPLTVFPFILRGVTLAGISSQSCPMPKRIKIWNNLASKWKISQLKTIHQEIKIDELSSKIDLILKGKIGGRIVVNMQ